MNTTLSPLLRRGVLVFMDDILVYSKTYGGHLVLLGKVLQLLKENDFLVKRSKCSFAQRHINYLGHHISGEGVATLDEHIQSVKNWEQPQNVRQLRGFLGLAGYYRKFVRNFGVISRPLNDLLKKNTLFVWTPTADAAFQALKQALVAAPVLALPDFSKKFVVETDASATGIGAVLMQDSHPVAYLSKALAPRNLGLSAYEKECLALLLAVDHWRAYLQHSEFVIRTDQRSLLNLTDQRLNTPIQQRAFTKLVGLQFQIQYKAGPTNRAADALSRRTHTKAVELAAIAVCKPTWLEAILASYCQDPAVQTLLGRLALEGNTADDYVLQDGIIRFQNRIWIGDDREIQTSLIKALHDSAVGGHSGFHATYNRVRRLFAWKGLKQMVQQFVRQCMTCQQAKTERISPAGLLQPLPIPKRPWAVVSLDFIEGLPKSNGYDVILVVVDKFSKYAHFVLLKHPYTALSVATSYMQNIFKLHGLPMALISDRDRIFTSSLWQELFRLSQTQLRMSSSYHPQTDGQTERVNQCLETYLRCSVHACPKNWAKWIFLAEYWYNTSFHSALGRTPYEVLYGTLPREFGVAQIDTCTVPDLEAWLREREVMRELLQQQLKHAQDRMKKQADKRRTDREFEVGDSVFLKLQPFIQSSVEQRPYQKLAFRYYGPYKVEARIGKVAYKLKLPDASKIHPVVHVSQLKKALGEDMIADKELPPNNTILQAEHFPVDILARRVVKAQTDAKERVLVRWSALPLSLATWEEPGTLRKRFPSSPAWGQAGFEGGEIVRTVGQDATEAHKTTGAGAAVSEEESTMERASEQGK